MGKITIQCDTCIKQDVCRELPNFKFGVYNILKSNTTAERNCIVPVEDNDFMHVIVQCKMYRKAESINRGGAFD